MNTQCQELLGLQRQGLQLTVAAPLGSRDSLTTIIKKGRGFLKGFSIVTDTPFATSDLCLVTVTINAIQVLKDVPLIHFIELYNDYPTFVQAQTPGGVEFTIDLVNNSGVTTQVEVILFYDQLEAYPQEQKTCVQVLGLRYQAFRLEVVPGVTGTTQFSVPQGVGFVVGCHMETPVSDKTDTANQGLQLQVNGENELITCGIIQFINQYNQPPAFIRALTPGGEFMNLTLINASAQNAIMNVIVEFSQGQEKEIIGIEG